MNRAEAIEYWEGLRKTFSSQLAKEENHFGRMHLQTTIDALNMAISAILQQEPNDWICTLKCTALMDEGMCSHGGLCCLYESQRTIKENQPLTLDELRQFPIRDWVWIEILNPDAFRSKETVSAYYRKYDGYKADEIFWCGYPGLGFGFDYADCGKTWMAYRQKPEEGTV